MYEIDVDLDATAFSYMGWHMITRKSSPQYKLRELYRKTGELLFDPDGLADIYGRKIVACTDTFGEIGDEIEITFEDSLYPWRNGRRLFAIIGDHKDQNDYDPPCDKWGHIYSGGQHCVIEFIVNTDVFYGNKTIKNTFPCLKNNPVVKITKTGVNFLDELEEKFY